jgi:hypothetical protein
MRIIKQGMARGDLKHFDHPMWLRLGCRSGALILLKLRYRPNDSDIPCLLDLIVRRSAFA